MKSDTLQLASDLALALSDSVQTERYYRDIIYDLGDSAWLTAIELIESKIEFPIYALPDTVIRVLGVFYDDNILSMEETRNLDYIDPQWHDRVGDPIAYTREHESNRNIRLYPSPELDSKPFSFVTGTPLGYDYPEYAIALLHTQTRNDVLPYMELPVALHTLALEFSRESTHRDPTFAGACDKLSSLLMRMIS